MVAKAMGMGKKNLIRKEKRAKNRILELINIKKLVKSEKPTEMTEDCSGSLDRMILRKSRWKRVSRKRECLIKVIAEKYLLD